MISLKHLMAKLTLSAYRVKDWQTSTEKTISFKNQQKLYKEFIITSEKEEYTIHFLSSGNSAAR